MDLIQKPRLLERLALEAPTYPKSMRKAAAFVIDNPAVFGMNTIRQTSAATGASTNTLVRLAQKIGFQTYNEFRAPFRDALVSNVTHADTDLWISELHERGGLESDRAKITTRLLDNVIYALKQNETVHIEQAAEMMVKARTVYFVGMRAPYALVHYLYYVGRMAIPNLVLAPRHANTPIDEIITATEDDLIFAVSTTPFAQETIDTCRAAKRRGLKIIMMSDSAASALPFEPDILLLSSASTPYHFDSFTGFFALAEWLLSLIVQKAGPTAAKRISQYNKSRLDANVYW